MDRQTARVIHGYSRLTEAQKTDVRRAISYGNSEEKVALTREAERVWSVTLGPLGDTCPCCGR
jgi:hypothetical protein